MYSNKIPYLSYTGWKKFRDCPESYKLEYVDRKRPPMEDQRNVLKGNALHNLMESYIILQEDNPQWMIDNGLKYWEKEIAKCGEKNQPIGWLNGEDEEKQKAKFLEWVFEMAKLFKDNNLQPIKLKAEFKADRNVTLGPHKFRMAGRIDVLGETKNGDTFFLDLKGSERKGIMDLDQLVWYSLLVGLHKEDMSQPKFGGYILPGFKELKLFQISGQSKEKLKAEIVHALDCIRDKKFPAKPTKNGCYWCPVKYACSVTGGNAENGVMTLGG